MMVFPQTPFAGYKESGFGRIGGPFAIENFTNGQGWDGNAIMNGSIKANDTSHIIIGENLFGYEQYYFCNTPQWKCNYSIFH